MSSRLRTIADFTKALIKLGHNKKDLEDLTLAELKAQYDAEQEGGDNGFDAGDSEEEDEEETPSAKSTKSSKDAVTIFDKSQNDAFVRTYSKKLHGAKFKELAKQFCDKFPSCYMK